jgi:hypothetical protein
MEQLNEKEPEAQFSFQVSGMKDLSSASSSIGGYGLQILMLHMHPLNPLLVAEDVEPENLPGDAMLALPVLEQLVHDKLME